MSAPSSGRICIIQRKVQRKFLRDPIRDVLDDGPELPSQAARDRAAAKIESQRLITDAERINFLEKTKYLQTGIGLDGGRYAVEVRFRDHRGNLKRFFGRSLRAAIDAAIQGEV